MVIKIVKRSLYALLFSTLILTIIGVYISNRFHLELAHILQIERIGLNEKRLSWDNKLNKTQGYNQCASYSSMAYIYSKSGDYINPKKIDRTIPGKLGDNTTYPWGIVKYLNKYNIDTKIYWHGLMTESDRENWIKSKVSMDEPVIIMTGTSEYLHFITVLGFENNTFHIYDSLNVEDLNGNSPGNIDIKAEELMLSWKSGRYMGIPVNFSITI